MLERKQKIKIIRKMKILKISSSEGKIIWHKNTMDRKFLIEDIINEDS